MLPLFPLPANGFRSRREKTGNGMDRETGAEYTKQDRKDGGDGLDATALF